MPLPSKKRCVRPLGGPGGGGKEKANSSKTPSGGERGGNYSRGEIEEDQDLDDQPGVKPQWGIAAA